MNIQELLDVAEQDYHRAKLDAAKARFEEILNIDSRNTTALNFMGLISLQSGLALDAIEWWKKSLAIKDTFDALSNLGYIYSRMDNSQAKAYFQRAFDLNPDRVDAAVEWAHLEGKEKNYEKAEQILLPILEVKPPYETAFVVLSQIQGEQGKTDEAEKILNHLLSLNAAATASRLALAQLYYQVQKFEQSADQYEEILKALPGHTQVEKEYGCLLRDHIDTEKSIEVFNTAIKSTSSDWELYYHLGIAFEKINMLDEAIRAYEEAKRVNSAEPFFENRIAELKQSLANKNSLTDSPKS